MYIGSSKYSTENYISMRERLPAHLTGSNEHNSKIRKSHVNREGQISESYRRTVLSNRFSLRCRRSRCHQHRIPLLEQPEAEAKAGRQQWEWLSYKPPAWHGDSLPKQQVGGADAGVARGPARIHQCRRSTKQHEGDRRPTVEMLEQSGGAQGRSMRRRCCLASRHAAACLQHEIERVQDSSRAKYRGDRRS
jgi:hypothetical protein